MRKWISLLLFTTILLNLVMVAPVVSAEPVDLEALRASTNLYANPGFDLTEGALTGWTDSKGILTPITEGDNTYVKVNHAPFNNGYYYSNPRMSVKSGRYYMFFTKMKWVEGNDKALHLYGYPENVLLDISTNSSSNKSISSPGAGQWKTAQVVVKAAQNRDDVSPMVVCWGQGGEFYIDDIYLGELMVADIDCSGIITTAAIPKDNEPAVRIPLSGKALNQAGNEEGLGSTDAPITWTLVEAKQGVRIENNTLIIDSKASSDTTVKVKASCHPDKLAYQLEETNLALQTAYLDGREKEIEITLTPNDYTLPRAVDIVIDGSPNPGTTIRCDYTYAQVTGEPEGATELQWYYKTPEGEDYEPITGAVEREFAIPSDYPEGCAYLVKITPKTAGGQGGETYTSEPLVAPMAPYVKEVKILSPFDGDYAVGDVLTADYIYVDANDFGVSKEDGTTITWYRMDQDVETVIDTGPTYQLTQAEADHYVFIKVKPHSSEEPNAETEYPSEMLWVSEEHSLSQETILQVRREETNLLTNEGFEAFDATTKKPDGWSVDEVEGKEWTGRLVSSNEKAYRGAYSGKMTTAVIDGRSMTYGQAVTGQPGKTYLVSAMALPAASNGAKWQMYSTPEKASVNTSMSTYTAPTTGTPEWTRVANIVQNTGESDNISVRGTVICWTAGNTVYVDDFYIGELMVADVDCSEIETEATIPKKGEPNVEIELVATAYNQIGTQEGLSDGMNPLTFTWSLKTEKQGVYIDGNKLIITDMAMSDTKVKVRATCEPTFLGADAQEDPALLAGRTKLVEINLLSNDNKAPRAENVRIEGMVAVGQELECKYDYTQIDGELESGTEINWYYKEIDEPASAYRQIETAPGVYATGETYTIASGYEDKHIVAKVTPKSETGKVGTTVTSPYVVYPKAPEIKGNVTITGNRAVDETLTATYTFFDDNGDEEGATSYRWVRIDGEEEIEIGTEKTYTVTDLDINKKIYVEVIPASDEAPYSDGTMYTSSPVVAAAKPVAENVSIKKQSSTLLGATYTYSHPGNIPQGATICEWYINGKRVHTGTSFNSSSYKGSTVTLKVTPVATLKPYKGDEVSATYTIPKERDGGGGPTVSRIEYTGTVQTPEVSLGNIVKYPEWMRPGIQFALSNGIMSDVTENEFMPDLKIKRADFLRCVMDTLGLEASEYTGIFGDISDADGISGYLQTAVDKGIISRDDNFYPNRNVSRAEICKILIAGVQAVYPDADIASADLGFADAGQIQNWAYEYVQQAVGIKLLNGMSETEFAPLGDVTRAQTATMVMRLHQYAETKKGDE